MRTAAFVLAALVLTPGVAVGQVSAPPANDAAAGTLPGTILFESRIRYEGVRQDGLDDATGVTARLRLGWRSPTVSNLTFLIEGEAVQSVVSDFNDTIHGPATRAVIADPDTVELNRLQVTWTGLPDTEVTVGRQRIVLGNARFIGNVGFRQNEQTFDAVRVTTTAFEPFNLTYAYIDRVHRVFGDDSPVGEWQSDSHLVQAETPTPAGTLSLYGYWLDFPAVPGQSSATMGARLSGTRNITANWSAGWTVELARQSDYGSNPGSFDLGYSLISGRLGRGPASLVLARESLDGDGSRGFQTPLATLHAFQGWADVFLTTPARGLTDTSATAAYTWAEPPVGRRWIISASWRDFSDGDGSLDFGNEFDAAAQITIGDHWGLEAKLAVFDGTGPFADREKAWLALEYRF
ncbi:MAG: hypothetical protein J0L52_09105 [Caulobacterales bacterium]|nr:hypothetical protein [Caulobacterales bacterium]